MSGRPFRARVEIGGHGIGAGGRCFIIAEAGVNHCGSVERAHALVDAAAEAGADAVKFQTFDPAALVTDHADKAAYQRRTTGSDGSQRAMLEALALPVEAFAALKQHCEQRRLVFLSTPYDDQSLDLLVAMHVAAIKIASTDVTNDPMLVRAGRSGVPMLLSTGMCDDREVRHAVDVVATTGLPELVLLQCTSDYPAPESDSHLRVLASMHTEFGCPVGFSDHTTGIHVAAWAVAAGASVIEKHFTLSRTLPGPDHAASVEPPELAALVAGVRAVEAALGDGTKRIAASERGNKAVMQKAVVARRRIEAGEPFSFDSLTCKRPALGLPPSAVADLVGRHAARAIEVDEPVTRDCVDWS